MFAIVIWVLRISNWINWGLAALFCALLVVLVLGPSSLEKSVAEAFGVTDGSADGRAARAVWFWLVWSCGLIIPVALAVHLIFTRLRSLLEDARAGLAFTAQNADRLSLIAWSLLAINVIDLVYGQVSIWASAQSGEYFGWAPSLTGWFAVILLFLLAKVFREGDRMRQDLEGTV